MYILLSIENRGSGCPFQVSGMSSTFDRETLAERFDEARKVDSLMGKEGTAVEFEPFNYI